MYVTGDFHGYTDIKKMNSRQFPANKLLTKQDYVIVAGDFGLVWDEKEDELYWRKWLTRKNFTTLFIDGNHENFELLDSFPVEMWNGGKIHRIHDSIIHLMRGQVFTVNGCKIFTFGGAASHDKPFRKENINWWAREMPSAEEYAEGLENLERHNWKVDAVITHTCPSGTLKLLKDSIPTDVEDDELSRYLEQIKSRLDYKRWYFGHFHHDIELPDNQRLVYQSVEKLSL
jgi:predicted phosphodiesterase